MIASPREKDFHVSVFHSQEEADRLRLTLSARRAWGIWLQHHVRPDHFVTLTFRHPARVETAIREVRRWIQRVGQRAKHRIGWFYALERRGAGYLHLHVLVTGTRLLPTRDLERAWCCGRADASPYDPAKGASYYVTKDVGFTIEHYDIARPSKFANHPC